MDASFWHARWREGRIGFHEGQPNAHLVAHEAELPLRDARVLVPLCGKSVDLSYLAARAQSVVGVELAEVAVRAFFEEANLPPHRTHDGPYVHYEGANIDLVVANFFSLTAEDIGVFGVCFDRASLVAIHPADRPRYRNVLHGLLAPGAVTLLVVFEHDAEPNEPPFSVDERAVHALFHEDAITLLATQPLPLPASFTARGATAACEKVYRIVRGGLRTV